MLVGHFAVGFAAKRSMPRLSLGTLVLAAMAADLLWCLFMIAGWEHIEFTPGMGAANYYRATDIALSHSLLMDGMWAGILSAVYFARRHDPRGAWLVFAAVLSHWVLDMISHRPDMPLAPGVANVFGLGLWTSVPATLVVEGGFWTIALVFYTRTTRSGKWTGTYLFWGVIVLLTLAWYNNIAGPPPPNPRTAPYASLIVFSLAVVWAYWMNRVRTPIREDRPAH